MYFEQDFEGFECSREIQASKRVPKKQRNPQQQQQQHQHLERKELAAIKTIMMMTQKRDLSARSEQESSLMTIFRAGSRLSQLGLKRAASKEEQTRKLNGSQQQLGLGALVLFSLVGLMAIVLSSSGPNSASFVEAIKLQPEGREKFYWSGEQFVITCQNTNNIKNVKIRWIGPNGQDITEDRSQRVHAESTGPHGHRLVIMNATASTDDGLYKCTLGPTNDRTREHIEFNLKIYKSTSFRDTARHLVLPTGSQGVLTCRVEFDPNVLTTSVHWVRDQKPIEMYNDSQYLVSEYDASRQLSQLNISPLTKQHDGVYTCRAMAMTAQLSKISDHDIILETNYAPHFDESTQTLWVERSQSLANRRAQQQLQQQQQQPYGNHYGKSQRNRLNKQLNYPVANNGRARVIDESGSGDINNQDGDGSNSSSLPQVVRVELRCTCHANPPASILWTSTANDQKFVLAKGQPLHVLEEPRTEIDGHNTTSILVVGYNLDLNWPYRRDQYLCSASNKLGVATKTFSIEQGDPPPAFSVGPHKHYNPLTSLFEFTLLGPNFDPSAAGQQQELPQEIVPPVDAFRIRAESPHGGSDESSSSLANGSPASNSKQSSYWSHSRKTQNEPPNVQWSLGKQSELQQQQMSNPLAAPQNFTINLGKLPSGNQKLYLEAHNAVGWSPNSTYLGVYYIVSSAPSLMSALTHLLLAGSLLISALVSNSFPTH